MKKLFLAAAIASVMASPVMAENSHAPIVNPGDKIEEPIDVSLPDPMPPVQPDLGQPVLPDLDMPEVKPDMPVDVERPLIDPIMDEDKDERPLIDPIHNEDNDDRPLIDPIMDEDKDDRPLIDPIMDEDKDERPLIDPIADEDKDERPLIDPIFKEDDSAKIDHNANGIRENADDVRELYEQNRAQDKAIGQNRADINKLFSEVDRLDDRIDGTQASLHAVTNARPFLSGEGKTAIGVGLGNSGSVSAVAIGGAHAFTDQWSASATINSTFGSDDNDFSFGVGTQYEF